MEEKKKWKETEECADPKSSMTIFSAEAQQRKSPYAYVDIIDAGDDIQRHKKALFSGVISGRRPSLQKVHPAAHLFASICRVCSR